MSNSKKPHNFCPITIDYSKVPGDAGLPFTFALDHDSILHPLPDQYQRFIYTITRNDKDPKKCMELDYFLLVVCSDITEEMLTNVSVTIEGVPQNVIVGTNVRILPPEDPDNATGCPGLKFDFGLTRSNCIMVVSFDLRVAHPIGSVVVCVNSGHISLSCLSICGPSCGGGETCPVVGFQRARICIPVTITPFAHVGNPTMYCCNEPIIRSEACTCNGTPHDTCSFTITQDICIAVPVTFGATACVGDYTVQCIDDCDADPGESCPDS